MLKASGFPDGDTAGENGQLYSRVTSYMLTRPPTAATQAVSRHTPSNRDVCGSRERFLMESY